MFQRPHTPSARALDKPYRFVRLPLEVDAAALLAEIEAAGIEWLSAERWKWHMRTSVCLLRAGPEGKLAGTSLVSGSGIDKEPLRRLPRIRRLLNEDLGARASLAWIGLSPPGSCIFLHVDNTAHWDEHHRIHVPIVTTPGARLCTDGRFLHMPAGTVWGFNNSLPHGAINDGPPRIHLLMDLPNTAPVRDLLLRGEQVNGKRDAAALKKLARDPVSTLSAEELALTPYLSDYLRQ